jgi:hypothetical protein
MKKIMKQIGLVASLAGLSLLMIEPAQAQGLNTITTNLLSQFPGVAKVMAGAAYVMGVGFGIKAALKFKESNESKGQVPMSQAIVLAAVSACLLALPSFLSTGKDSVFGTGTQGNTLGGDAVTNIR